MTGRLKRLLPLAVIVAPFCDRFRTGVHEYLSLESLRANQVLLQEFVDEHPYLSATAYVVPYGAVVALSLPGGAIMSEAGGLYLASRWEAH